MLGLYRDRYSYFFETFEGFAGQDDDRALPALKYMCLCKIMMNLVSRSFKLLFNRTSQADFDRSGTLTSTCF